MSTLKVNTPMGVVDLSGVPINKWGYPEWGKLYGRLTKAEHHSHGYEVKPEHFNDLRREYPELYLVYTKEEADQKLLAYASLLQEWTDQLTLIPSEDDPRVLELVDPDEDSEMPSLSDLLALTRSTFMDVCLPIRNTLERERLLSKVAYWKQKIEETEIEILKLQQK